MGFLNKSVYYADMTIGKRLRQLRKNHSLTQKELADKLGLNGPEISRWELGKVIPDPKSLEPYTQHFNVTMSYLLGHSQDPLTDIFSQMGPDERALAEALAVAISRDPQHRAILDACARIIERGDQESAELVERLLRRLQEGPATSSDR